MTSSDDFDSSADPNQYHPPISEDLAAQHVSNFMTKNVITAVANSSLKSAIATMIKKQISAIPIVDSKDRCVGIFSEFDAMLQGASSKSLNIPLKFSPNPMFVNPDTRFRDALILLISKRVKRLLVLDKQGMILGIVARRDFLKAIIDDANKHALKIKK
jgi:predicted transcriptional regulator